MPEFARQMFYFWSNLLLYSFDGGLITDVISHCYVF